MKSCIRKTRKQIIIWLDFLNTYGDNMYNTKCSIVIVNAIIQSHSLFQWKYCIALVRKKNKNKMSFSWELHYWEKMRFCHGLWSMVGSGGTCISNGSLALMGFPELTNQLIHTWFNPVLSKQQQIYPEPYVQPGTQLRHQKCYFWSWPKTMCVKLRSYFSCAQGGQTTAFWQTF